MHAITPKSLGKYEAFLEKSKKIEPLKVGPYIFRFKLDPLNNELIEKAKNELNETVDAVNKGLADLRELLRGETELNVPDDDYFFATFLRPCKWHAKPAFQLMKQLYHYNMTHPVYSDNLTPMDERDVLSAGCVAPLPVRTRDECRVFLVQCGTRWNPDKISLDQMMRGIRLVTQSTLFEPKSQVCGSHIIFDLDGFTLSHALCFTPRYAKVTLDWVQKCYPGRIKESLLKVVDRKAVPKYMGGDLNVPIQPLGKPLWEYFCNFQEELEESVNLGYSKK